MANVIDDRLAQLVQLRRAHIDIGKGVADFRDQYLIDLLSLACLNRSVQLLAGFAYLIEHQNFVCAAPLIRLQLDNCLRYYGSFLADDTHGFVSRVMAGEKISSIKDARGNRMTDQYLVEQLALEESWVVEVYRQTSGYVHLSDKHVFNAIRFSDDASGFEAKISDVDKFVPDSVYLEAIAGFEATTILLLRLIKASLASKRRHYEDATEGTPSE